MCIISILVCQYTHTHTYIFILEVTAKKSISGNLFKITIINPLTTVSENVTFSRTNVNGWRAA